tara:strand:- start:631 stop:2202 length:1572 start_codon:yes stop_codon:yes gene_type:complete
VVSLSIVMALGGCLERTHEGVEELDSRYVVAPVESVNDGSGSAGHALDLYEGETVTVGGEITGLEHITVDFDLRDESGQILGKWVVEKPGPWTYELPIDLGVVQIQAFQDLLGDGPTDDDPFGWIEFEVGSEAVAEADINLEPGGKLLLAQSLGHGGGEDAYDGPTVFLRGVITSDIELSQGSVFDIDFRSSVEGMVYKASISEAGEFEISVPVDMGGIQLQAFQDISSDGPSDEDPFDWVDIVVEQDTIESIELNLVVGGKANLAEEMGHGTGPEASGAAAPFGDWSGEWTLVTGTMISQTEGAVQVDFRVTDATAPGGNRSEGRTTLPELGSYRLEVPRGMGSLIIEAFQDLDRDGPTAQDPWVSVELEIGDEDRIEQDFQMMAGARGVPRGDSEGTPSPSENVSPTVASPFGDLGDDVVQISGLLVFDDGFTPPEIIDLDLFAQDPTAPGGRSFLGKIKVSSSSFSFFAPSGFGILEIDAFGDIDGDGPTPGDPFGSVRSISIESDDIDALSIQLHSTGE